MPFTSEIDHVRREIRTTVRGPVTVEDIRNHLNRARSEGALAYPEIYDAREAEPHFTPADVRRTVDLLRDLRKGSELGPGAIIVGSDLAYGMLRMLEILVEDFLHARPFRSEEEAHRWLETLKSGAEESC
jgi:hypothetical protein